MSGTLNGSPHSEFGARFVGAAREFATSVAVLDRGQPTTYADLLVGVEACLAELRRAGARPGEAVALETGREQARVVQFVALLVAGAVPILLDPAWPARHRRELRARCGARLSFCANGLSRAEGLPRAEAPLPAGAAYVVCTSGSGGDPKCVVVGHRGLVPMLDAQIRAFGLAPGVRSLFMLGLAFDASISDIGAALLSGATLVLEGPLATSPERLFETVEARAIHYLDLPPAYLSHLELSSPPSCLRTLVLGGEVSPPALVREAARSLRVFNVYGPSEATVCTSLVECDTSWEAPLLGQPIAGNVYALREDVFGADALREDAVGDDIAEGELLIGGPGVALLYLGDDDESARRFLLRGGERWFCTGDRVRRQRLHVDAGHDPRVEREPGRRSTRWEFLGRVDRQLKLRGQLVAPEQVEAALLAERGVAAASVALSPDGRQLVARVELCARGGQASLRGGAAPHGSEPARLLNALRERLPAHLVPARVDLVGSLPRNAHHKLEHRSESASLPERLLGELMARALDVHREGDAAAGPVSVRETSSCLPPDADFFEHGGDSLLALQVAARAEAAGLNVSAQAIALGRSPRGTLALAREDCDLMTRAELDAQVRASPVSGGAPTWARDATLRGQHVLLTGVTGSLGQAMYPPLLEALGPRGRLSCLVREPARGRRAVVEDARVEVVPGDVARPRLGLDARDYGRLARQVGVVVHLAAQLSAATTFAELARVNVEGTRSVLGLAHAGRHKHVLHASTLSVFTESSLEGESRERDNLEDTRWVRGAYAQTKWVAERLARAEASPGGLTVVRLGLLTGAAHTGEPESSRVPGGHLARFLRGLARLRAVPHDADPDELAVDITPVDFAAHAMVELLERDVGQGRGRTYHLAASRPATLGDLIEALEGEGIPLARVPAEEFIERAARSVDPSGDTQLAALSLCRTHLRRYVRHRALDLFASTGACFSTVQAARALQLSRPRAALLNAMPQPSVTLLRRYVREALS